MLRPPTVAVLLFCTVLQRTVTGSGIINGARVPSGSMRYMVSVKSYRGHVCGGFLVRDRFVLTAAHCSSYLLKKVAVGNVNLKYTEDIVIEKEFPHPLFKETRDNGNDLLLLKLKESAPTVGNVTTIQLPNEKTSVKPKGSCQVAGWGASKGADDNLTQKTVSIIEIETCKEARPKLPHNVICTHGDDGDRFSPNDAGGPLVCKDIAAGILSFTKYGEGHLPGVFVDISKYMDWINGIINE